MCIFKSFIKCCKRESENTHPKQLIFLFEDLIKGKEASESLGFPSILRNFRTVNVEMISFQIMPMHMCFLGIEKSLIAIPSMVANR
jgi:hypothetical protein